MAERTADPFARDDKAEGGASIGQWAGGSKNSGSLHYASPDFLLMLRALTNFMRLSLRRAAHAAVSSAAWQEIRVRSARDDKGDDGASIESSCRTEGMTKGLCSLCSATALNMVTLQSLREKARRD
jgi:hypothetical protein